MAMTPSKSGNGLYRPLADINVTPLVDVMLVLLIIFMVTAPMLASGMKVNLPQAKQIQPLDPKAPIIITIGKDGSLNLGSDTIDRDKLIDAIHEKLGGDINQIIHLRGDKEAVYGDVVAVMDLLAANGLTHIAIVADPHAKPVVKPKLESPMAASVPAVDVKVESVTGQPPENAVIVPVPVAPSIPTGPVFTGPDPVASPSAPASKPASAQP